VKVLEHTEKDRTICEKISGTVVPEQIEKVMKKEISKNIEKTENQGIDNNGFVKILAIDDEKKFITVRMKVLKSMSMRFDNVFVTFYDKNGDELQTEIRLCFSYFKSSFVEGEVERCSFTKPRGTFSYKVRLLNK
jgi:hypothetical protein